jgi:hypothetical protein
MSLATLAVDDGRRSYCGRTAGGTDHRPQSSGERDDAWPCEAATKRSRGHPIPSHSCDRFPEGSMPRLPAPSAPVKCVQPRE